MALRNLVAYTGDGVHLTSQEVANVTNQLEGLAAYAVDDVMVYIYILSLSPGPAVRKSKS